MDRRLARPPLHVAGLSRRADEALPPGYPDVEGEGRVHGARRGEGTHRVPAAAHERARGDSLRLVRVERRGALEAHRRRELHRSPLLREGAERGGRELDPPAHLRRIRASAAACRLRRRDRARAPRRRRARDRSGGRRTSVPHLDARRGGGWPGLRLVVLDLVVRRHRHRDHSVPRLCVHRRPLHRGARRDLRGDRGGLPCLQRADLGLDGLQLDRRAPSARAPGGRQRRRAAQAPARPPAWSCVRHGHPSACGWERRVITPAGR